MELDKRIKPNKKPLTCFDIEKAKEFLADMCYFSLTIEQFENLDKCNKLRLSEVNNCPAPFVGACDNRHFCFILPCKWVDDPNDVENLKSTIAELRKKIAEQEKTIERLNGIAVRKESVTEEPYKKEVDEFIKNLEKLLGE